MLAMLCSPVSDSGLLAWGMLGGLTLYTLAALFPRLNSRKRLIPADIDQWLKLLGLLGSYVVLGGVAAWAFGSDVTTHRQAFTYGLGWPTLWFGAGQLLVLLKTDSPELT
jgi:hypothetical protein